MKILGLDTSTDACSVALWSDGAVRGAQSVEARGGHAERLAPMVRAVMGEADDTFEALEALAVTVGPGSFTGIRIGLAMARGLALAAGCPLVGCTSLEVLAAGVPEADDPDVRIVAALDARRDRLYAQAFGPRLAPLFDAQCLPADDLAARFDAQAMAPIHVVGTGSEIAAATFETHGIAVQTKADIRFPDARVLVRLAASRVHDAAPHDSVRPLYLREPGAAAPSEARSSV